LLSRPPFKTTDDTDTPTVLFEVSSSLARLMEAVPLPTKNIALDQGPLKKPAVAYLTVIS
jgi:hypothetical protein